MRLRHDSVWWAPHRASWWVAVLFILGSVCFLVAPLSFFAEQVGAPTDTAVFFVGSIFFTSAATLQWLETINTDCVPAPSSEGSSRLLAWEPRRIDWVEQWGSADRHGRLQRHDISRAVHSSGPAVVRPGGLEARRRGSICFLVAGYLAYVEVAGGLLDQPPRTLEAPDDVSPMCGDPMSQTSPTE